MMRRRGDDGQATVFVLGLALVTIAVSGVAVDGTRAFLYRRTLQNAADAAALAGASELETKDYYSSGGATVELDAASSRRRALEWLDRRGLDARAVVTTSERRVRVALRGTLSTSFLSLVGIGTLAVAADAAAEPQAGAAPSSERTADR